MSLSQVRALKQISQIHAKRISKRWNLAKDYCDNFYGTHASSGTLLRPAMIRRLVVDLVFGKSGWMKGMTYGM